MFNITKSAELNKSMNKCVILQHIKSHVIKGTLHVLSLYF